MKKSNYLLLLPIAILIITAGCTKTRTANIDYFKDHAAQSVDTSGEVLINEFVASGSTYMDADFNLMNDWIELYNSGTDSVSFEKNNLYITDDSTKPDKFLINKLGIGPKKFLVVSCDDSAVIKKAIHTNFGLSKSGEFVGLFRKRVGGGYDTLTWHPFSAQTSGSEGRYPDGGNTWTNFPAPTPGYSNTK